MSVSRAMFRTLPMCLALSFVAVTTGHARAQLPGEPDAEVLERLMAEYHPDALAGELEEGEEVWFLVDREGSVLHTGVMAGPYVAIKVAAEYPREASDYVIMLRVDLETGRVIPAGTYARPGPSVLLVSWVLPR